MVLSTFPDEKILMEKAAAGDEVAFFWLFYLTERKTHPSGRGWDVSDLTLSENVLTNGFW